MKRNQTTKNRQFHNERKRARKAELKELARAFNSKRIT